MQLFDRIKIRVLSYFRVC